MSGMLAQRVLGQYEFPILEPEAPARLLFVSPNLAVAASALDAEPDELLRWVALHEVTHALQFGGVPWLRPHIATMVRELLGGLQVDPVRLMKLPDTSDFRSMVDKIREGDLATLIVGPERRAALDAMQAFMAVLEGYAEHVMDEVGAEILPNLPELRGAMDRRRRDRSGLMRIFEKLIGMDMKLRQYELGKKFCDAVAKAGGITALNRVWEGPAQMPTLAELEAPDTWMARTAPRAPPSAPPRRTPRAASPSPPCGARARRPAATAPSRSRATLADRPAAAVEHLDPHTRRLGSGSSPIVPSGCGSVNWREDGSASPSSAHGSRSSTTGPSIATRLRESSLSLPECSGERSRSSTGVFSPERAACAAR